MIHPIIAENVAKETRKIVCCKCGKEWYGDAFTFIKEHSKSCNTIQFEEEITKYISYHLTGS